MKSILFLKLRKFKREYHLFLVMTIMALVLTMIMGGAMESDYRPPVGIVDQDQSALSIKFINGLTDDENFNYFTLSEEEGLKDVAEGSILAAVVIPPNFESAFAEGGTITMDIVKSKDMIEHYTIESRLNSELMGLMGLERLTEAIHVYFEKKEVDVDRDLIGKEVETLYQTYDTYRKPISVSTEIASGGGWEGYNPVMHTLIGFTVFFSGFTIVFAIGDILEEKRNYTWNRQLVSPISRREILGANMVYTLLIGVFQFITIMLIGQYLFKINWFDNVAGIMILVVAYVGTMASLGLVLTGLVKNMEQLSTLTPIIMTSTGMLGGCMWPLEIISSNVLLLLASLTPQKWVIQGIEKLVMYNGSIQEIVLPVMVLLFMMSVYFTIGTRLIKASR